MTNSVNIYFEKGDITKLDYLNQKCMEELISQLLE